MAIKIGEIEDFYRLLDSVFYDIIEPKIQYRDVDASTSGSGRGMNVVDRKLNLYFSIKRYRETGDSRMFEDAVSDYNWFIENYPYLKGRKRDGKNKKVTSRNNTR